MYSPDDIRNITFSQVGRNKYVADEVDDFVDNCAATVEQLVREKQLLEQEKAELASKLELLANKLVEYRQNEQSISEAMLRAQNTGRTIILEANQKADLIMKDARIKAENIHETALREIEQEQKELQDLKKAVSDFKDTLLSLYREHLKQIDLLPEADGDGDGEDDPADPPVADPADKADDVAPSPAVADDGEAVAPVVKDPDLALGKDAVADDEPADALPPVVRGDDFADRSPTTDFPAVMPIATPVLSPDDDEDDPAPVPSTSRFANLQFGEDYEADEPRRGLFGRKK